MPRPSTVALPTPALTDGVLRSQPACLPACLPSMHPSFHQSIHRSADMILQPGSDPTSLRSKGSPLPGEASGQGGWGVLGALGPRTERPSPSSQQPPCALPTMGWASWGRFPGLFAQDTHNVLVGLAQGE